MTTENQAPEGAPSLSAEGKAFEAAMKETWHMIDPLRPPPAGTYWLGEHNGIAAALKTLRENYDIALAALAAQPQAPADHERQLDEVLKERDAASDYIDALLDEVLGADRHEWTSAYGHADAMAEVRERMSTLLQPMADRAWNRFEAAIPAPAEGAAVPANAAQAYAMAQVLLDVHAALGCNWGDNIYKTIDDLKAKAQPKGTPAGFALVPLAPTTGMVAAWMSTPTKPTPGEFFCDAYTAMLAAAPGVPSPAVGAEVPTIFGAGDIVRIRDTALAVFHGCGQEARDVIEWYHASLLGEVLQ